MPKATKTRPNSDPTRVKKGPVVPHIPGTSSWFAVEVCRLKGLRYQDPVGQDLLAIGIHMSEADRRRLIDILTAETS